MNESRHLFSNFKMQHESAFLILSICFFLVIPIHFLLFSLASRSREVIYMRVKVFTIQSTITLCTEKLPMLVINSGHFSLNMQSTCHGPLVKGMSWWPIHKDQYHTKPDNKLYTIFKEICKCDYCEP